MHLARFYYCLDCCLDSPWDFTITIFQTNLWRLKPSICDCFHFDPACHYLLNKKFLMLSFQYFLLLSVILLAGFFASSLLILLVVLHNSSSSFLLHQFLSLVYRVHWQIYNNFTIVIYKSRVKKFAYSLAFIRLATDVF